MSTFSPQMTTKKNLTVLGTIVLCSFVAEAFGQSTTVNFTAGPGQRDVVFGSGTPLPDGNQVRIGYFSAGFDVNSHAADMSSLATAWNALGVTDIKTIFGQPGRFGDTFSTTDPQFGGEKICLWIFKTTDNAAPQAQFQNVTSYGLFSSSAANWLFPQWNAIPPGNTTSINSSEINQAFFGAFDPAHLYLTPIPEPSAGSLLLLSLLSWRILRFSRSGR